MKRGMMGKRVVLPVMVLLAGLLVSAVLIWTAPETKPEEKTRGARVVQVLPLEPVDAPIQVSALGRVVPARQVVIRPEVRGRVVRQHPDLVPGGYISQGEELFQIDRADYELALTEKKAALQEAKFESEVEQGRQVVASREWRLLEEDLKGSEVNRSLVLREPHLQRTEARMRRATNEIAKAELDLERTSVVAPFNAMVLEEAVEDGQLVESGTEVATLVGADEFWVQATLPLNELRWIALPGPDSEGAAAEVTLEMGEGESARWEGRVTRLLSDLDPVGRMARVLVRVRDPLRLDEEGGMPLLLGALARVEIDAGVLRGVLEVPRAALREGNKIWLVDGNDRVRIRDAEVLWRRQESVLIRNVVAEEERLIVGGLRTALPGMEVIPATGQ